MTATTPRCSVPVLCLLAMSPAWGQDSSSSSGKLKEHAVLRGTFDTIWSLSFARDNQTLAAGLEDKTVRVWDVVAGKELAVLREHKDVVRAVAFSPDGTLLASGSKDNTVKLWSWAAQDRGKLLATLEDHKNWVLSVAFSPNGKLLASGGKDGKVKIWDVATRKVKITLDLGTFPGILPAVPRRASSLAFSPNGRILGAVVGDQGRLWDVNTGRQLAVLAIQGFPNPGSLAMDSFGGDARAEQSWSSAAFISAGKYFATSWNGSKDRAPIKLWDTTTGRPRDLLQVRQVAFTVNPGEVFPIIDTRGSDIIKSFGVSPNGKLVATGGFDVPFTGKEKTQAEVMKVQDMIQNKVEYVVKLWDGMRGTQLARLKGHQGVIWACAFSPDSSLLATGGRDATIHVWLTGKALQEKKAP